MLRGSSYGFRITPFFAQLILRINPFHRSILVMCRGYNDDDANFTELVWEDDCDLDFGNREEYPEFQLWFRPHSMTQFIRL